MALALSLSAVACSKPAMGEQPLTEEQVQLISGAFYRNHTSGGISFALSTVRDSGSGTLTIQGDVDYVNLVGHAAVAGGTDPYPVAEVFWGGNTVLENRPMLWNQLAALGYDGVRYIARDRDVKSRRLDILLQTVMGMATSQPENAVLVRQREGSAFVRNDELRGVKVQVLRFGDRLTLWIDPATGDLLRFEGTNSQRTFPIVIDVLSRGARTIETPFASQVVSAAKLGDTYLQWAPQSP